jgi:hypothetical protein
MVEDMGSILQKVGFFFCHWQSHKQYILSFTVLLVLPRWICLRYKSQLDNIRCGIFFECTAVRTSNKLSYIVEFVLSCNASTAGLGYLEVSSLIHAKLSFGGWPVSVMFDRFPLRENGPISLLLTLSRTHTHHLSSKTIQNTTRNSHSKIMYYVCPQCTPINEKKNPN